MLPLTHWKRREARRWVPAAAATRGAVLDSSATAGGVQQLSSLLEQRGACRPLLHRAMVGGARWQAIAPGRRGVFAGHRHTMRSLSRTCPRRWVACTGKCQRLGLPTVQHLAEPFGLMHQEWSPFRFGGEKCILARHLKFSEFKFNLSHDYFGIAGQLYGDHLCKVLDQEALFSSSSFVSRARPLLCSSVLVVPVCAFSGEIGRNQHHLQPGQAGYSACSAFLCSVLFVQVPLFPGMSGPYLKFLVQCPGLPFCPVRACLCSGFYCLLVDFSLIREFYLGRFYLDPLVTSWFGYFRFRNSLLLNRS